MTEELDSAKMAEIVNRCVKCKCSLAAADKTSKLLPCLHTMCDECVSGRTDVLEKIKKLKEESNKEKEESSKENEVTEETEDKQATEGDQNEKEVEDMQETTESTSKDESEKEESMDESAKLEKSTEENAEKPVESLVDVGDSAEENVKVDDAPEPVPLTECPTCREPFNIDNLIENVFIRKHMAASEDGGGGGQQCTGCESNPASSYCLQCDDWLCADCVDAHKRVRMTKDHQLTSREEAAENKVAAAGASEVSMLCRLHPKEKLTLFCEKCEVLTCRDCQLLQHQEHKYQFLQEAADSYKAKLSGSLSLMKDRRDILKRYQTEIEERLNKVRKEKGELQQEILKQADIIVKAVRAAIWSVLSSLHSFTDAAAKRLSREVGDVGDLVGKFDHCISFMDSILGDGYGLPLLFSKSIVETKCRKVYHTHMEPQSLKGQLNIQYRHDVPALLRMLSHIGAIFVNGSKYPPEKTSSSSNSSSQNTNTSYSRGPPNTVVGAPGGIAIPQQNIPPHVAAQDRGLYMQMMMGRQSHAGGTPTQGSTLSLPGSRRVGMAARTWQSQPGVTLNATQAGMIAAGMMVGLDQGRSQSLLGARAPPFTPMRLHHRPVDQMPTAPPMVLGSQLRPQQAHAMSLGTSHLPAPPPLRSPQTSQYRGAAESGHLNSGGQAATSGVRRGMDSQDPARPASGGHTPERPLSAERNDGASAVSMRVKSEPTDSGDCVITSAVMKGKKSPVLPTSLGEMQKNLDEVIRGVPLDLGDNLEQINGEITLASTSSIRSPPSQPLASDRTPVSTPPASTTPTPTTMPAPTRDADVEEEQREDGDSWNKSGSSNGGMHPEEFEATGPEVKGYATGNSMPGFTLAAVDTADPNDDYCAACHQGGDVLCCDQCPRVYHLQCHVPVLTAVPSGAFVCTLCEEGLVLEGHDGGPAEGNGKRKAPTGLSDRDLRVCERILLELFCHPSSIPFHEAVNRAVPNYYKIITNPMDFTNIKCKLSRNHFNHYSSMEAFLDDLRLVFKNCAIYNAESSEVGKAGKIVRDLFERLVGDHMPDYSSYASRPDASDEDGKPAETSAKKRKTTPPPPSRHHHEKSGSGELVHVH